jgi:hypothetical protein
MLKKWIVKKKGSISSKILGGTGGMNVCMCVGEEYCDAVLFFFLGERDRVNYIEILLHLGAPCADNTKVKFTEI